MARKYFKISKLPHYSEIESKLLRWVLMNRYRVSIFFLTFLAISFSPSFPYINLFINKSLLVFLLFFFFTVIFNLEIKIVLFFICMVLFLALGFYLIGEIETAELFGNFIYGILFAGTILYTIRLLKIN